MVHPHEIAGETCHLVQPQHIGATWSEDNLHLRSSIWNSNGELVSASFKKFVNWEERPDLQPAPADLSDAQLVEKVDGSTLIVSKYQGQLIVRTRGTSDASKLDNGHEIPLLLVKYPNIEEFFRGYDTLPISLIFEWVSPLNRIVIAYPESDLILIGAIWHNDYSLWHQSTLDPIAQFLGVKRPTVLSFRSIDEMLRTVEVMQGQEGICVYYNGGQSIRKVKSARYLMLHRLKSELGSISKVLDLYLAHMETEAAHPPVDMIPQCFYDYVAKTFDFEIAEQVKPMILRIEIACTKAQTVIAYVRAEVRGLVELSRKEAALSIIARYGNTPEKGIAFLLLDNRPIPTKTLRALIENELAAQ